MNQYYDIIKEILKILNINMSKEEINEIWRIIESEDNIVIDKNTNKNFIKSNYTLGTFISSKNKYSNSVYIDSPISIINKYIKNDLILDMLNIINKKTLDAETNSKLRLFYYHIIFNKKIKELKDIKYINDYTI